MGALERIILRKPKANAEILNELINTTEDRIKLRYGIVVPIGEVFPLELESIVVEVVTAMYNEYELNHEGVKSETVDGFKIEFNSDLLNKYDGDIKGYLHSKQIQTENIVRFL